MAASLRAIARPDVLLAIGAIVGAVVAAREIAGRRAAMPDGAAAVVNGVPIAEAEVARAVKAVAADRGVATLSDAERASVLDRLIEEELLLGRALSLDLPRRDPRLRSEIVATVVADVIDAPEGRRPTDAEGEERLRAALAELRADADVRVRK